jgi:calcineurin-like phosphoesterase family protein
MSVYFIGDPHLGHKAIGKYRPWTKDSAANSALIHKLWNDTIRKNDIVYVMGDAAFTEDELIALGNLRGRKILLKGNHDDFVSTKLQSQVFEEIHGIIKYKAMWLSHAPIHPAELRGKCNIHGHVHKHSVRKWYGSLDKRYYNTCVDVVYPKTGNVFVNLETVKSYFGL